MHVGGERDDDVPVVGHPGEGRRPLQGGQPLEDAARRSASRGVRQQPYLVFVAFARTREQDRFAVGREANLWRIEEVLAGKRGRGISAQGRTEGVGNRNAIGAVRGFGEGRQRFAVARKIAGDAVEVHYRLEVAAYGGDGSEGIGTGFVGAGAHPQDQMGAVGRPAHGADILSSMGELDRRGLGEIALE